MVVESVDQAVEAVRCLDSIDRRTVRARFEERFTAERMARDYVKLYQSLSGVRLKTPRLPWRRATAPRLPY